MTWNDIEKAFLKAWSAVFSKQKLLVSFAALSFCGVLLVLCRALAVQANSWTSLSLLFLPILLSAGFLLSLGVFLIRLYARERKGLIAKAGSFLAGSAEIAMETSYLSVAPVLAYILLWIVLGLFFLLKEIPLIGPFFNVVLAFGPFLLIVCSLLLCLLSISLLFFAAPTAALRAAKRIQLAQQIWHIVRERPTAAMALFLVGLAPGLAMGGLLTLAAVITNTTFSLREPSILLALEWFFVLFPFSALLSPAIVFFFNFSAESHYLLTRKS